MRECALCTLDNWLGVAHSDKMLPYITVVLTNTKVGAVGHKGFFDWLQNYFMATAIFRHDGKKPTIAVIGDSGPDICIGVPTSQCCGAIWLGQLVNLSYWETRLYKIMKEWKNPKVLREKPILMVSVVDDFVTSHIKLKASVAPTKSTSSAVTGGMDGLPREDISERISPT
ncbi:hypothetical protein SASPL_111895 [Salvia splendens]|uniref:Uncharacterized protein n=1 Tax=Salvia splendens TaxID=180675 RepID=A0A8X9A5K7_SALSN|nr:hypothetical protein SASPL_111895 [Salvia splendens]